MNRKINHTWFYEQSSREVWEYLTKPELIAQWLMENDFQPVVGHEFQFRTRAMPQFDFDGIVYCKVLEIIPYKKLLYSWKGGPGNGIINLDSIVEWNLVEKDNGTELSLTHSGLMENSNIYSIMNDGWLKNIKEIGELLNVDQQ